MLKSLQTYTNFRPDVDWNTCGQAAIASILDYHGIDPWGLSRSHGRWDDGAAIDRVIADGFGPDIVFGWGSSGGRIAAALRHYGLCARSRGVFFQGGWAAAWPELQNLLERDLPVPVLLDLGRLEGKNYVFHWAIAYAYDDQRVHLASVGTTTPTHQQFLDAWRCDFIFIPMDLKFCSVPSFRLAGPGPQGDTLGPGQVLTPNAAVGSNNGRYLLRYQDDGNLVLYRTRDGRALWDTRPRGKGAGMCVMQPDGNLVVYDREVTPAVWWSGTHGNPGSRLVVQDDGNLVIYAPGDVPLWATDTVQPNLPTGPVASGDRMEPGETLPPGYALISADNRFSLVHQGDGNLVWYRNSDGSPLWATGTDGSSPGVCILQGDGNFVLYDADVTALFDTGTGGDTISHLVAQTDGNLVLYRPDGSAAWATDTYELVEAVVTSPAGLPR
ncbi:hypothetical protein [Lentzea kentuckyensis]|uniref:hypothetical protein n=1 Tax=Lentzea kentuckyensis TaxID=360086 RepID=UPI001B80D458|nr:hypothetical protein [Lentzea kentuckyensis]